MVWNVNNAETDYFWYHIFSYIEEKSTKIWNRFNILFLKYDPTHHHYYWIRLSNDLSYHYGSSKGGSVKIKSTNLAKPANLMFLHRFQIYLSCVWETNIEKWNFFLGILRGTDCLFLLKPSCLAVRIKLVLITWLKKIAAPKKVNYLWAA